jgi:hypothetical protein
MINIFSKSETPQYKKHFSAKILIIKALFKQYNTYTAISALAFKTGE